MRTLNKRRRAPAQAKIQAMQTARKITPMKSLHQTPRPTPTHLTARGPTLQSFTSFTSHSETGSTSATSCLLPYFHPFRRLPAELRLLSWKLAAKSFINEYMISPWKPPRIWPQPRSHRPKLVPQHCRASPDTHPLARLLIITRLFLGSIQK